MLIGVATVSVCGVLYWNTLDNDYLAIMGGIWAGAQVLAGVVRWLLPPPY